MKTIVNKLRFALVLGFLVMSVTAWSQAVPYINKMSVTTQMFLDEMEGNIKFEKETPPTKFTNPDMPPLPRVRRPIVSPDTIDGKVYIAATVRITNDSYITDLESTGVIIQCKFDKGLLTTLIPIDLIDKVAAIEGVTRINVSSYLRPLTKRARQATNVDDVLSHSADAIAAGLPTEYDGSGVILGVIDDGIDFQHGAFKDKNGNSRIKGAYCYNGSSVTANWTGSGTLPTTDDTSEDHGTHTSTIAGGSSVIVSGTNVTVTDNHANATYGGMAPGADMFLAGTQLATNHVMNSFQKMCNYADQQGKPLVVSNSWSSAIYSRDGYSDMADVLAQYFGDSHPNRICLFAAGNEAGMANGGTGGGRYVTGNATEASPVGTIVRSTPMLENYGYQYYSGIQAVAWTRATNAQGIGVKIHVINKTSGALQNSYTYTSTNNNAQNSVTLSGLNMTLYVYFDYVSSNGKHMVLLYAPSYKTTSNYLFAMEVYPIGASNSIVDIYGGDWTYLTGNLSTSGHTWQYGTDDLSMSDEPMNPNVISVGSYVTWNGANATGDISDFSSYCVEGVGPQGTMHPWITAPGEVIISGINHYVSSSNHGTVTVNNSTSPYGEMSGTSMATPAVAGIVALWLQAAQSVGKDLTLSDVKTIMKETAIRDNYVTNGANRTHFGNGKIDALAGIQYILSSGAIIVDPTELTFGGSDFYAGISSQSLTVTVTNNTDEALHLTIAGLNASLAGTPFNVTAITNNGNVAANGGTVTITITYAPTVVSANDQATLTIAEDVTVALTGSCVQAPDPYAASVNPVVGTLPYGTVTTGTTVTKTITITNEGLNPFTPVVNVNAPFVASYDNSSLAPGQSRTITVSFTPDQAIAYSEQLTITAPESNVISFNYTLTGAGENPYIAATVAPTTLNFTNKTLGQFYTNTVTITNTGTQVFTPVINTDNLPAVYTVTGNGQVAIGNSINLTVTYSPTAVGTHNGSFTVTIGNETYTVYVYGSAVEVTEATVADGNNTNSYLPIYGNQYGSKQINQMIYPESMLSEIQGKKIKSMKFYPTTPLNFYGGAFTVKMGTTSQTTYPQQNYSRITTNMQTVKTGQAAVRNDAELVITFDEPFEYNSGNLVIDFEVTTTGTRSTSQNFYGVNQNGTYRAFNSYGSTINNNGRYGSGSRRAFLPKVTFEWENETPYVAGTVTPNSLTYTDVRIGRSQEQMVTVTNTGTMPFTPVIDSTNLPAEFAVTGNGAVAVGGTLDLTVTYSPTDEGLHSGSFTVTIGDVTYTVTVTGNGIVVNSTLTSNVIAVPVYQSEAEVDYSTYIFSEGQVLGDIDMNLAYPSGAAPGEVKVLAKNDEHILNYELHHKVGNGNWTYPNGNAVATANHVGNSYVVNDNTFTFPQDATEMWITMNDSQLSTAMTTYYIPVTVAKSIVETGSQDNTYGAPVVVSASDGIDLEVFIDGFKSASKDKYGNYTGIWKEPYGTDSINYCVYMPQVHVVCQQLGTLRPYMYRAWLLANDDITYYNFAHHPQTGFYGTTPITNLPKLLAERSIEDVSDPTHVLLPEELGDTYEGMNTFGAPVNVLEATDNPNNPGIVIAVRVYYQSADEENGHMLRGNRDGGYGFGEGRGSGNGIPTAIDELFGYGKQVVDVQYVNALGMQSKEPFDGLNIVVTRYSDGSITTTKVIK